MVTRWHLARATSSLWQHGISVCVWAVFKIQGFVCKRFLSSPPPPPSFNRSIYRPVILSSRTAQKRLLRRLKLGRLFASQHSPIKDSRRPSILVEPKISSIQIRRTKLKYLTWIRVLVSFVFIFASLLLLGLNSASVATTVCKSSENQGKIRSIFPNRSIYHYHILKLTEIPVSFFEARKKFINYVEWVISQ